MQWACLYGLLGHVWQLGCEEKGPCVSAQPWSLPVDDETQLDDGAQSYNIHLPGHDNNSPPDEHGYYNHVDVSRPEGFDYTAYTKGTQTECTILALILVSILGTLRTDIWLMCISQCPVGLFFGTPLVTLWIMEFMSLNGICDARQSIDITYKLFWHHLLPGSDMLLYNIICPESVLSLIH